MFNLSNETDYKLLLETKNYHNFFILIIFFLFFSIFTRLIILNLDDSNISLPNDKGTNHRALPTIYDFNKNILAYSDFNYSIVDNKNSYTYLWT